MTTAKPNAPAIILVEDNPGDVEFIRLAMEGCSTDLQVLDDGQLAIDFIESSGPCRDVLFVVDLNLPRRNGFEVLEAIRQRPDDDSCQVETVVLSSSMRPADHERVRALGAREFIVKPGSFDEIMALGDRLRTIMQGWFQQHGHAPRDTRN